MIRVFVVVFLWIGGVTEIMASTSFFVDTIRDLTLEPALVTAAPKEHQRFRSQPLSATVLGEGELNLMQVSNLKNLSAIVPNVYMSDYGSRLTGAVYMRGVGSRISTSAVGLYVDNVSFIDKSAFDFDFVDVTHVEVLRGPQGSLYGRGSMSGLVRISTADPLNSEGTILRFGASGRNSGRTMQAITYLHPQSNMGISLSGFYIGESGFYRNATTGKKADASNAGGGRFRWAWQTNEALRFDVSASYERSRENSNPYTYLGAVDASDEAYSDQIGLIGQNRQSHYRRDLFHANVQTSLQRSKYSLTSVTAYQFLSDDLLMDQDFLRADIFSLNQRQRLHNVSEELSFKGTALDRWDWIIGAFGTIGRKQVTCPVSFYSDGVDYLNNNFRSVLPSFISVQFNDNELPFDAKLKNTDANVALFHQSTLRNLFLSGLSLTVGLRLDYDYHRLSLRSSEGLYNYTFGVQMPAFGLDIRQNFASDAFFAGRHHHGAWQLLPKVAVQYDLPNDRGNVYFSVTKGYRSGGYNLENYSDLSQSILRRKMMLQVQDYSVQTITNLPSLSEESKQAAISGMNAVIARQIPAEPSVAQLAYKPEYSWNHEVGAHLNLKPRILTADVALFWLQTHDLQMARFAEQGFGREIRNAGGGRTLGAEISLKALLFSQRLMLAGTYGYAHSKFREYNLGQHDGVEVDYKGNIVPYAPRQTLMATAFFRQPLENDILQAVGIGADVKAAGPIWWDEANTFKSPFTAQVGMQMRMEFAHNVQLTLWGRNLTNCHYTAFSFESMSRRFAQYGTPRYYGIDLQVRF
ncbi:MAG: TonB-dependent receptor [Alloprevotella sp.]|nr:TonB-dependent receptor [Alloprevotella sp.]